MKQKIVNELFIERLNILKKEKGVSLGEIEEVVNISKGSMSKYSNGIHLPNSDVIRRLSIYFNVSADYLLGSSPDRSLCVLDGSMVPNSYLDIVKEAIATGISADEFKEVLETVKKFKGFRKGRP